MTDEIPAPRAARNVFAQPAYSSVRDSKHRPALNRNLQEPHESHAPSHRRQPVRRLGGGAIAQEATPDTWMKAGASKSRAQVKSELEQARKDGTIKAVTPGYDFVGQVAATKTREQVRAETAAARASGEYDALNAEV